MFLAKWRPILGAGILLASGLHLACDTTLPDPLTNPDQGSGTLVLSGGSDPTGDPNQDPQGGDPSTDPTGPASGGGGTTTEPGTDPGGNTNSSGGGQQSGGGPINVVPVDTRPVTMVTNLEDYLWADTPLVGSARWAIETAPTPGIIRFAVGGPINLKRTLVIKRPDLEIDGSTAPSGGITFQREQVEVRDTHDVVIKHLRFRSGDGFATDAERVAMHGQYYDVYAPDFSGGARSLQVVGEHGPCRRVRIENCSIQNSTDDNGCVWGDSAEVTFYQCLFSGGYALLTKGLICGTDPALPLPSHPQWVTLQQCLFINQWARMPDLHGDTVHLVNNVIIRPFAGGRLNHTKANVVGNCLFSYPNHPWQLTADRVLTVMAGTTKAGCLYLNGNLLDGLFEDRSKIVGIANQGPTLLPAETYLTDPLQGLPANVLSAPLALIEVLSKSGCSGPGRDSIDLAQIDQAAVVAGINPATVR